MRWLAVWVFCVLTLGGHASRVLHRMRTSNKLTVRATQIKTVWKSADDANAEFQDATNLAFDKDSSTLKFNDHTIVVSAMTALSDTSSITGEVVAAFTITGTENGSNMNVILAQVKDTSNTDNDILSLTDINTQFTSASASSPATPTAGSPTGDQNGGANSPTGGGTGGNGDDNSERDAPDSLGDMPGVEDNINLAPSDTELAAAAAADTLLNALKSAQEPVLSVNVIKVDDEYALNPVFDIVQVSALGRLNTASIDVMDQRVAALESGSTSNLPAYPGASSGGPSANPTAVASNDGSTSTNAASTQPASAPSLFETSMSIRTHTHGASTFRTATKAYTVQSDFSFPSIKITPDSTEWDTLDMHNDDDDDENSYLSVTDSKKKHHRHHRHHHHQNEPIHGGGNDDNRFTKDNRRRMGRGRPPLVGGHSMSPPEVTGTAGLSSSQQGTGGGILISNEDTTAHDYKLFVLTNHHVMANDAGVLQSQACQPYVGFRGGTCDNMATLVPDCGCCAGPGGDAPSSVMDASIVEIDLVDRFNTMCSVLTSQTTPASGDDFSVPTTVVKHVSGVDRPRVGDVVWKYGSKSHLTTGKITSTFGKTFTVRATSFPQFADQRPAAVTSTPGSGIVDPNNDQFWDNCARSMWRQQFMTMQRPDVPSTTPQTITAAEADELFMLLLAANRITGVFLCKGDSGSWLFKDGSTDNTAVALGLLNAGSWSESDRGVGTPVNKWGQDWWNWSLEGSGFMMTDVIDYINGGLASHGRQNVSVCLEAHRRTVLAQPTSCGTAWNAADHTCGFPRSCKVSAAGTSCVSRGRTGV